jgi:predicted LPLAT superfamily acyltransferase/glycosyltransferase involved in cell wall biosynthesis
MNLRFCIAVPTYHNPGSVVAVLRDCTEKTDLPIVVIDDGSPDPVERLVRASGLLPHLDSGRIRILRHEKNFGKGYAIQKAFAFAIENDFTHLMMMDGDGQHFASEIPKMVQASIENPWDLILGHRMLTGEHVPGSSKVGRRYSNFWVKFETEVEVKDSQSGFRMYPVFQIQNMKFWTKRFDFEIEVLIRLIWRDVQIREVEIECYYPPANERVTHFNKWWDNVRIVSLNILFVLISLLRKPQSSIKASIAFALGVAVGVTPLYGLHTLIVGAISFGLRLNFVYLWVGTQISLPFIAPFLVIAAIQISKALGVGWVLGFVILAVGLGIAAFFLALGFMAVFKFHRKPRPHTWNGKTRGGVLGTGFMKQIAKLGGLKTMYGLLYVIVPYFYLFAPTARRGLQEYWKLVDPKLGFFARQWKVITHLNTFAQILSDRLFSRFYSEGVFEIEAQGFENIVAPVEARAGLIMVTAHVGGWDMASTKLKTRVDYEFKMVRFEAEGLTFERVIDKKRGEDIAPSVFEIRAVLERGGTVGLMGDRPLGRQLELVKFFGRLAVMDATPFRIAGLCDVPVLFTFGFKGPANSYHFYATQTYRYSKDESVKGLNQYAQTLEAFMRKYPDQWFNFYSFWKTRGGIEKADL